MVGKPLSGSGTLVVGTEGRIYSPKDYGGDFGMISLDEELMNKHKVAYDLSPRYFREWVRAIHSGKQAMRNFINYAGPLTKTNLP